MHTTSLDEALKHLNETTHINESNSTYFRHTFQVLDKRTNQNYPKFYKQF